MFLKSKRSPAQPSSPAYQRQPRSLRLRLVLWYGSLSGIALLFFVVLVWELTTNALNQSVDSSVQAEARVADLALSRELLPTAPYWPARHRSAAYRCTGHATLRFGQRDEYSIQCRYGACRAYGPDELVYSGCR